MSLQYNLKQIIFPEYRSMNSSVNFLFNVSLPRLISERFLESQFRLRRRQPSKQLNKDQHQCHFANVFGKNSPFCSIHFRSILSMAAETIWCVVNKAWDGFFLQHQQDSFSCTASCCTVLDEQPNSIF